MAAMALQRIFRCECKCPPDSRPPRGSAPALDSRPVAAPARRPSASLPARQILQRGLLSLHKLELHRRGNQPGLVRLLEEFVNRKPTALAVIKREFVHIHADEFVRER